MTSQFKNTTITGTGALVVAQGTADQRPTVTRTVVSYTSGSGTWTVPAGVTNIELLMVGGGGGGGANSGGASYNDGGGGGGGGGLVYKQNYTVTPGAVLNYAVGAAGTAGNASKGGNGGNTTFSTLTALGGGGGGMGGGNTNGGNATGNDGGSGGGSVNYTGTPAGGSATQPGSATSGFGNAGSPAGSSASQQAGGGGGAGGAGGIASYAVTSDVRYSGAGGPGLPFDITGTVAYYAGGGGGGRAVGGLGGTGGIGGGGNGGNSAGSVGTAGTANTGGGGGGAGSQGSATAVLGSAGGSGVIHIRYVSNLATENSQGIVRYNSTSNAVEVYQNNEWVIQNPATNYAGHNMHQNSQDLSSYWTLQGNTLTSSNNVAPDGTSTAALVTTSTGYTPIWKGSVTTLAGVAHTMSGYFKAGTSTFVSMALGNNGLTSTISATFNFSTQAITGNYAGPSFTNGTATYIGSSMTSVGNGWYRCSLTGIIDRSSTSVRTDFQMTNSTTTLVWGLQLEQSNILGPYSKTTSVPSPIPSIVKGDQVHSFTTTGTSYWTPAQSGIVEVLVVAGGGGGGYGYYGGGGGAGGLIYLKNYKVTAGTTYTVVVGAGGAGSSSSTARASNGSNSQFGSLIAIGGGGGGSRNNDASGLPSNGNAGGSGGGGSFPPSIGGAGTAGQGFEGGGTVFPSSGTYSGYGMGGGGASGPGQSGGWNSRYGSQGGGGLGYSISGSLQFYAGGGGGGGNSSGYVDNATAGGIGGGGIGGIVGGISPGNGTANTGGGGGGNGGLANGATGGSGVVIVRYTLNPNITGTLDGSSPQRAGVSAAAIKTLTSTTTDGYYWINLPVVGPTLVYCDMNTASGGWMHCATVVDNNEAYNNSYNHPWAAPLHNAQYTGIWQDNSTLGSQSFTSDYKNNVWNYYPMTQQLMKDSGATLRNLWYTGASQITAQSLSTFWANRRWLADGSEGSPSAVTNGRVHYQTITNFGVNDAVFGSSGLDKILFKYGEYDGTQDGNKDRAMISYVTGNASDVDSPKGIGCHTSLTNDYRFRDIVPTAQNTGDSPPNSITGTHQLTLWVR